MPACKIFQPVPEPEFSLANSPQARKRARQAEEHRDRNVAQRSQYRTTIKKVLKAILAKDKTAATTAYSAMVSLIDRFAAKGVLHKNKAARHKSRLTARLRAMA